MSQKILLESGEKYIVVSPLSFVFPGDSKCSKNNFTQSTINWHIDVQRSVIMKVDGPTLDESQIAQTQ